MKIAIPTFATRVSPRFDCAQSLLMVTIEEGATPQREEFVATNWAPDERITRLIELGVDTVICGGIDRWSTASLQSAGVTVYGWVAGEAEEALAAMLRGDLDSDIASQHGGWCACRRFPGDHRAGTPPAALDQGARGHGRRRGKRGGGRRGGAAGG